ncbi:MAG: beta-glucosidase [Dysgonamonadaceae bacterium]|jgi:hypothetical protein|nr:beta-glucosidase [Dysgonamonadaceae bacterium]
MRRIFCILSACVLFFSCKNGNETPSDDNDFFLEEISVEGVKNELSYTDVSTNPEIILKFSEKADATSFPPNITLKNDGVPVPISFDASDNPAIKLIISALKPYNLYEMVINTGLKSETGKPVFSGKVISIKTGMDMSDKFERIPDEQLLNLVQEKTFRYFWDFAHPVSGMARERTTSGNTVTTGGTGFGIMAMIAAAERKFVSKLEALGKIATIVEFLDTKCTKYHGAFSHWINGETGATIPFSADDNGGDLVETAFLMQGLLTARRYFDGASAAEIDLRNKITALWEAVDWSWYRKNGENALYWHWSPDKEWKINLKISGWNEGLIVYVLAASSPTHSITKEVYDEGWTHNGAFRNGTKYYGITLPLGNAYGGPLFFTHYSFLGIDPNRISDQYIDYLTQNKAHSLINYNYCVENPKKFGGYSADCWGLSASDGNEGYSAHSPTNDKGVIAPTAAISSMPYTPEESLRALRFFYYKIGDKLWGEYGFYDAFNLQESWFDNQYIAIDQGPIAVMLENYRSGLLWSLFMSDPEIISGLEKLGFLIN